MSAFPKGFGADLFQRDRERLTQPSWQKFPPRTAFEMPLYEGPRSQLAMAHLERTNQLLGARIAHLEQQLVEVRPYLETIKHLFAGQDLATQTLQRLRTEAGARLNTKGALARARELDRLEEPLPDNFWDEDTW